MKSLRLAVVAALVLSAGAASAATKIKTPPYLDLTGCCATVHAAEHAQAMQRALLVPDRDRGKVLAETSCNMGRQAPAPTTVDAKFRR